MLKGEMIKGTGPINYSIDPKILEVDWPQSLTTSHLLVVIYKTKDGHEVRNEYWVEQK
jgi:hypothetical protein